MLDYYNAFILPVKFVCLSYTFLKVSLIVLYLLCRIKDMMKWICGHDMIPSELIHWYTLAQKDDLNEYVCAGVNSSGCFITKRWIILK